MNVKSLLRLSTLVILLTALAAGSLLTANAQGPDRPFVCNGLSEADCQLLQQASAPQQIMSSFSLPEWSLDASIIADQSYMIQMNGSGAFVLPQEFVALVSDFPQDAALGDIQPVITLLQKFDATRVQTLLEQLGLNLVIDSLQIEGPDQYITLDAEIIVKDMGVFLHLPAPNGADAWFGEQLHFTPEDMEQFDVDLQEIITSLQDEEFLQTLAQLSELEGVSNRLLTVLGKYVSTVRNPDAVFNGMAMASFTTSFDLQGFLADPDLADALISIVQNPAFAELMEDTEDLESLNETQIQFLLMTAGLLIGDTHYTVEQWVGLDDGFLHKFELDTTIELDLSLLGEEADFETATVNLTLSLLIDQINQTTLDTVDVPAVYYNMDDSDNFLAGTPEMIEANLTPGQTFAGTFTADGDMQDIYTLPLEAGETVTFTLKSDDYPYVSLYGPDGFLIAEHDTYTEKTFDFTAEESGTYLVEVSAFWEMTYEITIGTP